MLRYSKYFLQHALWLDDGFCQYFVQDDFWGLQEILDVQIMVFDCPEDAHQWLWQCAEHDYSGTLYQLRDYLAHFSQRPYILHRMNDRHVMRAAAEELSANMSRVVIQPYVGWAVQVDAQTDTPELPPRVEAEPELSGMLAELKDHLDALVIEQQRQYDKFEAHVAQMSPEQKALFYSQKAGGAVYDSAIGDAWEMVKAAPAVLWKAAKAFPGFYAGYLKTLWKVAQTPSKMAALTAQGITTGNYNPLKQEIDRIVTPVAMTYEQAVKYKSMLTVLFSDEQTHALLYDFAQRYYEATHPVELTQMAASAVADIVVTVILAIVTVGAGAAANVAAKSGRLVKVAKLLEKIAATLKRVGPKAKLLDKGHDAAGAAAKVEKQASKAARKKAMPDVERPNNAKKLDKNTPKDYDITTKSDGPKKTKPIADKKFKRKHLDGDPKDPYTLMEDGKPMGAEVGKVPSHLKGLDDLPANHDKYVKDGWPSLDVEYAPGRHTRDFRNFTDAKPDTLKPGTKIYRIIDDQSGEFTQGVSGSYWTTEMPKNKTAWRKDYAVKDSWNDNGYVIEETVGPEGLKVWRGGTAAQEYKKSDFFLRGGQEQIFAQRGAIGNPQPKLTNWPDL